MKIKRYQARDMRHALQQVRLEQGPDAVILSTQTIEGGVEICVADDYEQARALNARLPVASRGAGPEASQQQLEKALEAQIEASIAAAPPPRIETKAAGYMPVPTPVSATSAEQLATSTELRSLRALLERQLSALAWNDFTRRDPARAHALNELTDLGMPREDAWQLLQAVPAAALEEVGSHAHHQALARALHTTELEPLVQGPLALIGPPGAGKSTLLAKLAVRAVVAHGAAQIGIVTMDTQRLGAGDQARGIGRLLGIDTVPITDATELTLQVQRWSGKRLVLIDTAGVPPRDAVALQALERQLTVVPELRKLLVLPASAQRELLQCCLERFAALKPVATVLTRIDEALSLGGALAALLRHDMPLAALCDGPRVPEDLQPARSAELVARAMALLADSNIGRGATHAAA